MRNIILAGALLLGACHVAAVNVYDRPLPQASDSAALMQIRDGIKPADQEAWETVLIKMIAPAAAPIQSRTVGEAISRAKARNACLETHDDDACANINV